MGTNVRGLKATAEPAILRVEYGPITEHRRQSVHFHLRCSCGGHHEVVFDQRVNEPLTFSALGRLSETLQGCATCPDHIEKALREEGEMEDEAKAAAQAACSHVYRAHPTDDAFLCAAGCRHEISGVEFDAMPPEDRAKLVTDEPTPNTPPVDGQQ